MWKIGIWAEKIMSAAILFLQWQGENCYKRGNVEISHIPSCTLCQKKRYITKGIQPISKKLSFC